VADCERLHDGLFDQPVNTLSSTAYVAAGIVAWRHDRTQGAALIAVGVGSVAYHGFGGTLARWLHDATMLLLAIVVALAARRIVRGARARPGLAAFGAAAFAIAVVLQLFGRTGGALCRPDSLLQAHAGWHVLTATALAIAFIVEDRTP
jgi:hypothetical protein